MLSNAKYQRDMKVAIHVEERIEHKVCKAYSHKKSGGLRSLSTHDIAKLATRNTKIKT